MKPLLSTEVKDVWKPELHASIYKCMGKFNLQNITCDDDLIIILLWIINIIINHKYKFLVVFFPMFLLLPQHVMTI
jgi:hypothetical protein